MRKAALLITVASCGITASTAQAHFLYHHKHLTTEQKVRYFERSIQHEKHAIHWYSNVLSHLHHKRAMLIERTEFTRNIKHEIVWHRHALHWHEELFRYYNSKLLNSMGPSSAICYVFGSYCSQALSVVGCETGHTYSVYAQNGQYLGLFQMGSQERGKYGHSTTPIGQARAAYRYFVASGRDWSPWECKP